MLWFSYGIESVCVCVCQVDVLQLSDKQISDGFIELSDTFSQSTFDQIA